ncbi:ABC transporter substrate-binding protein [Actinophytocola sp.]|uniref:ABC transporter substrate-binding protein n=1 Tax=Actinophytocola sp. TaxID=1872138 RepID=UPI003D6C0F8E
MNWKKPVGAGAAVALAMLSGGCGDAEPGQELETIRVLDAGVGIIYFATHLAQERGYFEDEGVKVELLGGTAGGQDVTAALVSGDADVIQATLGNVIATREQGLDLRAIAPIMEINAVSLVVRNDVIAKLGLDDGASPEERMAALAEHGAKVGISSAGSGTDTFMRGLCKEYGVDCDSQLELVALGGMGENQAAFQQGQIDAVARSHPDVDILASTSDGSVFIGADELATDGGYLHSALIARDALIEGSRDKLVAFLRAIAKAMIYAQEFPDETEKFVHQYVDPDLDVEVFGAAWETLKAGLPADVVIDKEAVDSYYTLEREIAGNEPAVGPDEVYTNDLATEAQEAVADFKP